MNAEVEMRKQELLKMWFNKYDTFVLTRTQVARILNTSTSTLDRLKKIGRGPKFQKNEMSKNGNVTYMLDAVIDFLLSKQEYHTIDQ